MHKSIAAASFAVAFFLGLTSAQAQQKETIQWAIHNFPPYTVTDGPEKGHGIMDRAREIITSRLQDYDYEYTMGRNTRIIELLKSKPNVCASVLLRTPEREQFMEFTTAPALRILPNGIITTPNRKASLAKYLNENGELRLDAALADGKYKLAIERDRTFGKAIDETLQNPANQKSIVILQSAESFEAKMLKLVNRGEYDFFIAYAIEMKSKLADLKMTEQDAAFIPIAGASAMLSIPIGCSKSEIGKKYVALADKIIADPAVQQELSQLYKHWLDADTAKHYDKLLKGQ